MPLWMRKYVSGDRLTVGIEKWRAVVRRVPSHCDRVRLVERLMPLTDLTNREARSASMMNTRFTIDCGHDRRGYYSSARDLAQLAEAEQAVAVFLDINMPNGGRAFRLQNGLIDR